MSVITLIIKLVSVTIVETIIAPMATNIAIKARVSVFLAFFAFIARTSPMMESTIHIPPTIIDMSIPSNNPISTPKNVNIILRPANTVAIID